MKMQPIQSMVIPILLVIGTLLFPSKLLAQGPSPAELLAIAEARSQTYAVNCAVTILERKQHNTPTSEFSPPCSARGSQVR
jgi:hypothetical protein